MPLPRRHAPISALLALAACLAFAPGAASGLTLDEAVALALDRNPGLAEESLRVESRAVGVERAREQVRDFGVTPVGSAETGSGDVLREAGLAARYTAPIGTVLGAQVAAREWDFADAPSARRTEAVLSLEQPLFRNYGRLVREEPAVLAEESYRAARREWARSRSRLAVSVAEVFSEILSLEGQIAAESAAEGRWERLAALSGLRERRGEATRLDTMRGEWQLGQTRSRLETLRGRAAVKRRELADLLASPEAAEAPLEPPPALAVADSEEDAVLAAWEHRPELAQARDDVATAERQLRLAERGRLPDLRFRARQTFYGEDEEWSGASDWDESEWTVGLQGSLELNPRDALLAVEQAKLDVHSKNAALEVQKDRIALEVRTAWVEARSRFAEAALADQNDQRAAARAELAWELFRAGRGSADQAADAQSDAADSRLAAEDARRAADVAAIRLAHAVGVLLPDPLEFPDE